MEWSVCCNARWRDMSRGRSQFCLRKLIDCDLSVLVQEARETRSVVVKMLHTNYTNRSVYFVSLFVTPPPPIRWYGGGRLCFPLHPLRACEVAIGHGATPMPPLEAKALKIAYIYRGKGNSMWSRDYVITWRAAWPNIFVVLMKLPLTWWCFEIVPLNKEEIP